MRRLLSVIGASILLAIATISGPSLSPGDSQTASPSNSGRAFAQTGAGPTLSFTMYDSSLEYTTLPFAPVTAELRDAGGAVKAIGFGAADGEGSANVTFSAGPGIFDFGAAGTPIEPGDTLTLSQSGAEPLDYVVPSFGAEIDLDGSRLVGVGPAGATVEVDLASTGTPTSFEASVAVDISGAFALDLTDSLGLVEGGVSGSVEMTTGEGHVISADVAALAAEIRIGTSGVSGSSTPGTMVEVTVERDGEDPRAFGPTKVIEGADWSISLGGGGFGPGPGPGAGGSIILTAGDTVRITRSGGQVEIARSLETALKAMTIEVNPASDTVSGTAPADSALRLNADSIDGGSAEVSGMSGADGMYSIPVGGSFDLSAGWRVSVAYAAAPGINVSAIAVLPKARIPVHLPIGQGFATPGQTVTVTLRAASGDLKSMFPTQADAQGEYFIWLGGAFSGDPADLQVPEPGDTVELAFVEGDPTPMRVPDLSAIPDTDAETISGLTEPGAVVQVDVSTADGEIETFMEEADASGAYSASLVGTLDLQRPSGGTVSITPLHGNAFYTSWAAARLSVSVGNTLQGSFILGSGAFGRLVTAELLAPDGTVVADAVTRSFGGGVVIIGAGVNAVGDIFFMSVSDITGTPVDMRPGDTLRMTVADDVFELEIPPIDAVVFVDANTISGQTSANSDITMWVSQMPPSIDLIAETTSDGDGRFVYNFSGQLDLKYGDQIQLGVAQREHMLLNFIIAPGLLVDLDQSLLLGSSGPNNEIFLTLTRGGETLYSDVMGSDASGAFFAIFFDESFNRIVLQPGDIIKAEAIDPELDVLELVVPLLEIDQAVDTNVIDGQATPGGTLILIATETYARPSTFGIAQAWPAISAGGTWTADFVPSVDVKPGTQVAAIYRPENGHYALRTDTEPILNAEHSGPNACGFGDKRAELALDLSDAASVALANAAPTSRFDGYFSSVLRDTEGMSVRSAATNRVAADLGEMEPEIELGTLDLTPNWEVGLLSGTGPANAQYSVLPAVPCAAQQEPGILNFNFAFAIPGSTAEDGTINQFIPPFFSAPGSGVEIAFYAESDHRWFRQFYRALAEIYLLTDRVTGRTNTLEDVVVILRASDGTEKARAVVRADENGAFDARFVDGEGEPVVSQVGDTVVLQAAGETPEIPVETLLFDWSEGSSEIVGNGPAGRDVVLSLRFASGGAVSIDLTADAGGRWLFTALDVPTRADWSMADVVGVRATMQTPNGHSIISQTAGFEPGGPGPGPDPSEGGTKIFLPFASSNRAGLVADAGPVHPSTAIADRATNVESSLDSIQLTPRFGVGPTGFHGALDRVPTWPLSDSQPPSARPSAYPRWSMSSAGEASSWSLTAPAQP